jgi:hypothetical protein
VTQTEHRAQELLNLWDSIKSSRSCIHVVDIQQHKDNLSGLANQIRLGLYAEYRADSLEAACNEFELEYCKVKDKLHNDLIDGLRHQK